MHRGEMAARSHQAQQTITRSAKAIARKFGLSKYAEAIEQSGHRIPEVDRLYEREALAEFLDALNRSAKAGKGGASVESDPYEAVEISAQARKALVEAGYHHPALTAGVTDETLDDISGVAEATIAALRDVYPMSEDLATWKMTAEDRGSEIADLRARLSDLAGESAPDATESSTGDSSSSESDDEADEENQSETESGGE